MFGNGSLGALNVTSGTTYLPLNIKLQYTTVNVSAGATIRPADTAGAVLYICATESITIDGTINVSNAVNYGNNTWGVTIDGETFNSPGVANGGSGSYNWTYNSIGNQVAGFGGGGSGATDPGGRRGGNGGNGSTSPSGGGGTTVSVTSGSSVKRNNASRTNGGSGVAYAYRSGSSTGGSTKATGGAGGQGYGSNGSNGAASNTGGSTQGWTAFGGGGGGAGGRAGRSGVHVVLRSPFIIINGTINTSGTNGTSGGNGGRSRDLGGWANSYGGGGGGGGGGNAGDINIYTTNVFDDSPGTYLLSRGTGGDGGTSGSGGAGGWDTASDGLDGTSGNLNIIQLVPSSNFTSNITTGARPLTVNFTNLSQGATSYSWNFGDSSGSSQENPSHTYTSVGTYTVSLTATNEVGSTTETKTAYITTTINNFSRTAGGTLKFSGSTNPTANFYRSATGTLKFGGEVRMIVVRDAEVLQDKLYLYKVYDPDGNYIETWKDVVSELTFTHEINTIGSTTTVELARNSDTVGFVTAPLQTEDGQNLLTEFDETILVATESRNQIGSGSSVDYNNRVDITAFYGSVEPLYTESMEEILTEDDENILADVGAPNGRRIFTGFISEINSRYGNSESTLVQLTSYGFDLDQFPVTTEYDNNTTTVPFNSYDPSNIVIEAIERFEQTAALEQTSYTTLSDGSIDISGTVVSYTFRNNTYKELLDKTLELLPSNWYYRIGLGDNVVYVKERQAQPEHLFYLGKHIKSLDLKGSILDVVNHTLFTGGGDPALYVERKEAPAPRTRRGLKVMSDSRVTLTSSANIISDGAIEQGNKLQYRTTVEILAKQYDIESISVGETVGFRNFGDLSIDGLVMQIVGLSYTPDVVQLALETKPATINKRLADIQRNLAVTENQNTPATPS